MTQDNWETFLVNHFHTAGISDLSIKDHRNGYIISTNLAGHYIWCDLNKKRDVLNKLEFGRYLQLGEPGEHGNRSKTTSWTKGVYINNPKCLVRFMQTSWDGEKARRYKAVFNSRNQRSVAAFLSIPIAVGWTEIDYRLDAEKYYKATGQVTLDGSQYKNTFALKATGEQDIPLMFDRIDQYFRTRRFDRPINDSRRHIEKTEVKPIRP